MDLNLENKIAIKYFEGNELYIRLYFGIVNYLRNDNDIIALYENIIHVYIYTYIYK